MRELLALRSSHSFATSPARMSASPATARMAACRSRRLPRRTGTSAAVRRSRVRRLRLNQVVRILFGEVGKRRRIRRWRRDDEHRRGRCRRGNDRRGSHPHVDVGRRHRRPRRRLRISQLSERRGHDVGRDEPGPFEMRAMERLVRKQIEKTGIAFDERKRSRIASGTNSGRSAPPPATMSR